jgi:hypothetical protein
MPSTRLQHENESVAERPTSPATNQRRRLTTEEISALIEGHTLTWGPHFDPNMYAELYCRGRYELGGTRVPVYGTYRISEDQLCLRYENGDRTCRQFFVDAEGRHYRSGADTDGRTWTQEIRTTRFEC